MEKAALALIRLEAGLSVLSFKLRRLMLMMIIPYMVLMLMTLIEELGGDYDATYMMLW